MNLALTDRKSDLSLLMSASMSERESTSEALVRSENGNLPHQVKAPYHHFPFQIHTLYLPISSHVLQQHAAICIH